MLSIKELHTSYGGLKALDNVTIKIEPGQFVAIVGPNGAGKTTLFKSISGTVSAERGDIQWQGQSIMAMPPAQRPELGIAHVPEGRQMFRELTVLENLEMGAQTAEAKSNWTRNLDQVLGLFPVLGERRNQLAGTLSGGEQQMVAIGRGLMSAPKLLMLDEPSMGLAPLLVDEVLDTVRKLKQEGITILLVEQNVREALDLSDRAYVLQTGRIVGQGSGRELLEGDLFRE